MFLSGLKFILLYLLWCEDDAPAKLIMNIHKVNNSITRVIGITKEVPRYILLQESFRLTKVFVCGIRKGKSIDR